MRVCYLVSRKLDWRTQCENMLVEFWHTTFFRWRWDRIAQRTNVRLEVQTPYPTFSDWCVFCRRFRYVNFLARDRSTAFFRCELDRIHLRMLRISESVWFCSCLGLGRDRIRFVVSEDLRDFKIKSVITRNIKNSCAIFRDNLVLTITLQKGDSSGVAWGYAVFDKNVTPLLSDENWWVRKVGHSFCIGICNLRWKQFSVS